MNIDKDLIGATKESHDAVDYGKTPLITSFTGTQVTARRTDGTLITTGISPYPPLLFEHVAAGNWESAIRCGHPHNMDCPPKIWL